MNTTKRKNEDIEYIMDHIPFEDFCNCLAEEASELASAASKLLRIERGINPCAKSKEEVINNLIEEYTDTLLIAKDILGLREDEQRKARKISEWCNAIKIQSKEDCSGKLRLSDGLDEDGIITTEELKERERQLDLTFKRAPNQCNKCKFYKGVHNVMGHAPCSLRKIGGVMWNDYCSHFNLWKEDEME